jgi:hypothetical protein
MFTRVSQGKNRVLSCTGGSEIARASAQMEKACRGRRRNEHTEKLITGLGSWAAMYCTQTLAPMSITYLIRTDMIRS